jgi:hypothetical protein
MSGETRTWLKCKGWSNAEREVWPVDVTSNGVPLPTTIEVGVKLERGRKDESIPVAPLQDMSCFWETMISWSSKYQNTVS